MKLVAAFCLLMLTLSFASRSASACPSCRDSIASPSDQGIVSSGASRPVVSDGQLSHGFNRSIYVILCGLFLVTGTGTGLVAREVRRIKSE